MSVLQKIVLNGSICQRTYTSASRGFTVDNFSGLEMVPRKTEIFLIYFYLNVQTFTIGLKTMGETHILITLLVRTFLPGEIKLASNILDRHENVRRPQRNGPRDEIEMYNYSGRGHE
jgi:hypothetical protein